jgi:predicted xylose isomerase-like sugar epimerase
VEKMYKVERKHRRRKSKGARYFTQVKNQKLNRIKIREQLTNAHHQHIANNEVRMKYNTVDSVNATIALYNFRKIF